MTTENPWQRLSRIAYARMDYLGMTQADLDAAGGPSPAWVRKLKAEVGKPSARHAKSLRALSLALGWDENQAWALVHHDPAEFPEYLLVDEEDRLIKFGDSPAVRSTSEPPVSLLQRFRDALRTDPMAGVSPEEWADLLEAIEAKMPKGSTGRPRRRPARKTGS